MLFFELYIYHVFLRISTCLNVYPKNDNQYQIIRMANRFEMDVFNQCFHDKNQPIVIVRNWSIYNRHIIRCSIPVYLVDIETADNVEEFRSEIERSRRKMKLRSLPATKFVIELTELQILSLILFKLKISSWWNVNGFFLVKNVQSLNSCTSAYLFLKTIWDFNILNAVYMCHDKISGIRLFTFNPYNGVAPKFWKEDSRFLQLNGFPLTLYINANPKAEWSVSACEELVYDKTLVLTNYPIKISDTRFEVKLPNDYGELVNINIFETEHGITHLLWEKMGANVTYVKASLSETGDIDSDNKASGVIAAILDGIYESRTVGDFPRGLWKNEVFIYRQPGSYIIINKEAMSIMTKLGQIFSWKERLIIMLCLTTITVLYAHILQKNYVEIAIDVLRCIIGVSMLRQPHTRIGKVIFLWLIFAFMVVSSYLQSQLSAMLTSESRTYRDVNSTESLVALGYKAYTTPYNIPLYSKTYTLEGKISPISDLFECLKLMRTEPYAACLENGVFVRYATHESDQLHISKDDLPVRYTVFLFRDDSALIDRAQHVIYKLFECGFFEYLMHIEASHYSKPDDMMSHGISFDQLEFCFYFLISSYVFCSVILLLEIMKIHEFVIRFISR